MGPPLFQRSPRIVPELPRGEREVPPPPSAPMKPGVSLLSVLLPAAGTVAGLLFSIMMGIARGGSAWSYLVYSLPMMVISCLLPLVSYVQQKRVYKKAVQTREEKYGGLLHMHRTQLEQQWETQRRALCDMDPDPAECTARAVEGDARLWERSPDDPDFLAVRVGLGEAPFTVRVKVPREEIAIETDSLRELAQRLSADFEQVAPVPIRMPLRDLGVAGVVGHRPHVLEAVRTMVLQLATHHSPDEVKFAAVFPAAEAAEWAWLRWLPHVWSDDRRRRFLADTRESAHELLVDLYEVINRRRLQVSMFNDKKGVHLPAFVVILADPRLAENEPVLPILVKEGQGLGAYTLVLADRKEALPKECEGFAVVTPETGQLVVTAANAIKTSFKPDKAPLPLAEQASRAMAPLRLQQMAAPAEIPGGLPLLELFGVSRVEELHARDRWAAAESERTLAVPLGMRGGGEPLIIDLHEKGHGPHGLVAGATGSGKSELLQALIASLAVHVHPHEVVFVLVDFKGGALANVFEAMPHLVGTITNLQGNLAVRALSALRGEMRRRQSVLKDAGVENINDYIRMRKQGQKLPVMPHLVIVVDEFAELKLEQPEFMRELVSAVRVGRSLGVHLILATQKPAGVVDEQIWSNSRFRLCLRVERPEDSLEVIKRPDAASVTRAGRAFFQVGSNEVFELFQAAWGGAPYIPGGAAADPYAIAQVALDGSRQLLTQSGAKASKANTNQLQALVNYLADAARQAGIDRLPGPWLPPLPNELSLEAVRGNQGWDGHNWRPCSTWLEPAVGLVDDPVNQHQGQFRLDIGGDGHIAVYGAPGSGKTTLLQTLVTSLALDHSPADLHLYLLDFGGRSLTIFADLPHVGGVILRDEGERVNRLLSHLLAELETRKERFARAGANTLAACRACGGDPLPAIVLVMDSYSGFSSAYPDAEEQLALLAREGGNLGIHLVLALNSPTLMRAKVGSNITMAVTLQLAEHGEYVLAVGRTGGLEPAPIPGRGLVRANPPLEFQTALPASGETEMERSATLKILIRNMAQAWTGPRPAPVRVLPDVTPLAEILPPGDGWDEPAENGAFSVPVGLEVETLAPFRVDLQDGPHFLITGPVQSGKTTFLQTWLLALAERFSPERLQCYLIDFRGEALSSLQTLPHVRGYITDDQHLQGALSALAAELRERRQAWEVARRSPGAPRESRSFFARYPALVLAMDDYDAFRDAAQAGTKDELEQLVRRERGLGVHLIMAGCTGDLSNSWEGLVKALKELQTGILVGSSDHSDTQLFNIRLPMGESGKILMPGQGYYARRGRFRRIKGATCQAGDLTVAEWVDRIARRGEEWHETDSGGARTAAGAGFPNGADGESAG